MTITSENIFFVGSILVFCSIMISRTGYRFGLPALLLFIIAGLIFGKDGVGINMDSIKNTQFVGMAALCIILFTGGMETDFKRIRKAIKPGLTLSTVGVLLTTLITGVFAYRMSMKGLIPGGMGLTTCLLLAATMSSTDSASVFNILKTSKMGIKGRSTEVLELESGSNDPMAYVLTMVLISIVGSAGKDMSSGLIVWNAMRIFLLQFIVGGGVGVGAGYLISWIINKVKLDNTPLYAILLLCVVFFAFSLCGMLDGNSYLAVYIAGIIVGNRKVPGRKQTMAFLDGMTWLMQIAIFLILGLFATPHEMVRTIPAALLIGMVLIFLARPLAVFISLIPFRGIKLRSKLFISWVGLRGAAPIIFATFPLAAGIEGAETIFNIVFIVTLLSLILQGTTIGRTANWLRLSTELEGKSAFGIEIPDEIGDSEEYTVTPEILMHGHTLKELKLPDGKLVVMIKRGDRHIVPNGSLELLPGDRLLILSVPVEVQEPSEPPSPFIN